MDDVGVAIGNGSGQSSQHPALVKYRDIEPGRKMACGFCIPHHRCPALRLLFTLSFGDRAFAPVYDEPMTCLDDAHDGISRQRAAALSELNSLALVTVNHNGGCGNGCLLINCSCGSGNEGVVWRQATCNHCGQALAQPDIGQYLLARLCTTTAG